MPPKSFGVSVLDVNLHGEPIGRVIADMSMPRVSPARILPQALGARFGIALALTP